jgi:hypothetical protein
MQYSRRWSFFNNSPYINHRIIATRPAEAASRSLETHGANRHQRGDQIAARHTQGSRRTSMPTPTPDREPRRDAVGEGYLMTGPAGLVGSVRSTPGCSCQPWGDTPRAPRYQSKRGSPVHLVGRFRILI